MIKAALLDVDGTLVDSNPQHALAWSRALSECGYDVSPGRMMKLVGMGSDKILPSVDPALSDAVEPGASIARRTGQIFREHFLNELKPTRGAGALLVNLKLRDLTRVLATSGGHSQLIAILEAAAISEQFDSAATADDISRSKPDVDIVAKALQKANVRPSEAIFVGDTPYDVEAANKAGVGVIALRCGGWSDRDLEGAAAIYDDPADLLNNLNSSPFFRHASPA
jgi:HAD superfamily hydrolase (TIGR01509 family)